jgi:hypothetical protein
VQRIEVTNVSATKKQASERVEVIIQILLNHLWVDSRIHASAVFENAVISTANSRLTTVTRRPRISAELVDPIDVLFQPSNGQRGIGQRRGRGQNC